MPEKVDILLFLAKKKKTSQKINLYKITAFEFQSQYWSEKAQLDIFSKSFSPSAVSMNKRIAEVASKLDGQIIAVVLDPKPAPPNEWRFMQELDKYLNNYTEKSTTVMISLLRRLLAGWI